MEQAKPNKTRKGEIRFTTSELKRCLNKYIAKPVYRKWNEDFVDKGTGEVISIERQELLYKAGTPITRELASEIQFFMNAGDIKEIEVSNQKRLANEYKSEYLFPFKVTASIGLNGTRHFVLQAQSVEKAIEIARDYIELNFSDYFGFSEVKVLNNMTIIEAQYRCKIGDVSDFDDKDGTTEPAGMVQQNQQEDKKAVEEESAENYYKVEIEVTTKGDMDDESGERRYITRVERFMLRTKDADTASAIAAAFCKKRHEEQDKEDDIPRFKELSVKSSQPFPCNCIIERDFCMEYYEGSKQK